MIDDLFKQGRLADAIEAANEAVRSDPVDLDARHMLFVLLLFSGDVERAEKQLDVIARQQQSASTGPAVYQALLAAEWERRKVYEGSGLPNLPPDAPDFAHDRVRALQLLRDGQIDAAAEAIEAAVEKSSDFAGSLDDRRFAGLCDYDDVLGDLLEVYAGGRYLWVPFSHVRSIRFKPAKTAFDTLYREASIEGKDGTQADVYLPVLYAPSYRDERDELKLGRGSDWDQRGEIMLGIGQHVFLAADEHEERSASILEISTLEFDAGD